MHLIKKRIWEKETMQKLMIRRGRRHIDLNARAQPGRPSMG
jgi:hypothetical protein